MTVCMDKDVYLLIFLTFCLSIFFVYLPNFSFLLPYEVVIAFVFLAIIAIVFSPEGAFISFFILALFSALQRVLPFVAVMELHIALFCLGVFLVHGRLYAVFTEKVNAAGKLFATSLQGIGLFFALILLSLAFSAFSYFTGMQSDASNVYDKLFVMPAYILLFAVLFAPLSEEAFFRAFLAEKYGVAVSALAFSVSHIFYGSLFELAGAFLVGLALAYYYVKRRNLAACIIAHSFYNMAAILVMLLAKQAAA